MKQVLLGNRIIVEDVPVPGVGNKQVLVETAYSFISAGTEAVGVKQAGTSLAKKIKNHPNSALRVLEMVRINGVRKTFLQIRDRLDARKGRLGYSCSGRVIAVGKDVTDLAQGDLVACAGMGYATHAEVVAVPRNLVAKLPAGCDLRAASGTTICSIALQGVRRADLKLGETAVVLGLGLLGQITLQLLRASGVEAIGLDPDPWRVQEAKALGFENCFALAGAQAVAEVGVRCGGLGADAAIVTAASTDPDICQNAMEMTRRKGKVVIVGAVPLQFDREPFYRKEIDFLISTSYGPGRYDSSYEEGGQDYPYAYVRWTENRNMQAILKMIASNSLNVNSLIAAEYPVSQAEDAFSALTAIDRPRPLGIVLKYELVEEREPDIKLASSVKMATPKPLNGKIGLGVIGVGGFFTGTHLPNIAALSDRFQIVATCNRSGFPAQDIARRYGAALACSNPEELLSREDVQLIMVCTHHDTHASLAQAALKAGKHVFIEKPLAMNSDELSRLLQICGKSDHYLMVGFNRRFSPHARRLRELVSRRDSPLVLNYRVQADPAPMQSWIYSASGGGRVIGEACHMLDLFNYLVGQDVGVAEMDVVTCTPSANLPPGDSFVASIKYEDGSLCSLTYSTLGKKCEQNGKERVEAMWDGKTFVIDDFQHSFGTGVSTEPAGRKKAKGHYEELVALADYLGGKGPEPISLDACVRATELSFAIDAVCRQALPTQRLAGGAPG